MTISCSASLFIFYTLKRSSNFAKKQSFNKNGNQISMNIQIILVHPSPTHSEPTMIMTIIVQNGTMTHTLDFVFHKIHLLTY